MRTDVYDYLGLGDIGIYCHDIPYTSKHSRGKTFAVHQQYALCRGNFRGLQT